MIIRSLVYCVALLLSGAAFAGDEAVYGPPAPTSTALGGVKSSTCGSHNFGTGVDTSGNVTCGQPAFGDVSGLAEWLVGSVSGDGNITSMAFTGLTGNEYSLRCSGITLDASDDLLVQFGEGGTPTWKVTGYLWANKGETSATADASIGNGSNTSGIFVTAPGARTYVVLANYPVDFVAELHHLALASLNKSLNGSANFPTTASAFVHSTFGGIYTSDQAAITAVRLIGALGTRKFQTGGACYLYQLATS